MRKRAKFVVLAVGAASLCGALFVYAQGQAPAAGGVAGGQAAGAGLSGAAAAVPIGAVAAAGAALAGAAARSANATSNSHASARAHERKQKACNNPGKGTPPFC